MLIPCNFGVASVFIDGENLGRGHTHLIQFVSMKNAQNERLDYMSRGIKNKWVFFSMATARGSEGRLVPSFRGCEFQVHHAHTVFSVKAVQVVMTPLWETQELQTDRLLKCFSPSTCPPLLVGVLPGLTITNARRASQSRQKHVTV